MLSRLDDKRIFHGSQDLVFGQPNRLLTQENTADGEWKPLHGGERMEFIVRKDGTIRPRNNEVFKNYKAITSTDTSHPLRLTEDTKLMPNESKIYHNTEENNQEPPNSNIDKKHYQNLPAKNWSSSSSDNSVPLSSKSSRSEQLYIAKINQHKKSKKKENSLAGLRKNSLSSIDQNSVSTHEAQDTKNVTSKDPINIMTPEVHTSVGNQGIDDTSYHTPATWRARERGKQQKYKRHTVTKSPIGSVKDEDHSYNLDPNDEPPIAAIRNKYIGNENSTVKQLEIALDQEKKRVLDKTTQLLEEQSKNLQLSQRLRNVERRLSLQSSQVVENLDTNIVNTLREQIQKQAKALETLEKANQSLCTNRKTTEDVATENVETECKKPKCIAIRKELLRLQTKINDHEEHVKIWCNELANTVKLISPRKLNSNSVEASINEIMTSALKNFPKFSFQILSKPSEKISEEGIVSFLQNQLRSKEEFIQQLEEKYLQMKILHELQDTHEIHNQIIKNEKNSSQFKPHREGNYGNEENDNIDQDQLYDYDYEVDEPIESNNMSHVLRQPSDIVHGRKTQLLSQDRFTKKKQSDKRNKDVLSKHGTPNVQHIRASPRPRSNSSKRCASHAHVLDGDHGLPVCPSAHCAVGIRSSFHRRDLERRQRSGKSGIMGPHRTTLSGMSMNYTLRPWM